MGNETTIRYATAAKGGITPDPTAFSVQGCDREGTIATYSDVIGESDTLRSIFPSLKPVRTEFGDFYCRVDCKQISCPDCVPLIGNDEMISICNNPKVLASCLRRKRA